MVNKSEPRIILWDLETLPNLSEVMKIMPGLSAYPGLSLKASINSVICFGHKIYGEKETKCINAWDFKNWNRDVNDDYEVVKKAQEILKDADAIVTHNGKRFDLKFLQTRLAIHGLPALPKITHIDTCSVLKSNLYLFNNRLNTAGKILASEEKLENGGWELCVDVSKRIPKAMKTMTDYCKQDVVVLEKLYKKLLPFVSSIPNYNLYSNGEKRLCPNCGSTRFYKDGYRATKASLTTRLRCRDCGSNFTSKGDNQPLKTF